MTIICREVLVRTDSTTVWNLVSDIGGVAGWHRNVRSSSCKPGPVGVGAVRVCEFEHARTVEEQVSKWVEGEELWFAISRHGAVRSAEIGLVLGAPTGSDPSVATMVKAVADYHVAIGPVGPVVGHETVRRLITEMLDSTLTSLKHHFERVVPVEGVL